MEVPVFCDTIWNTVDIVGNTTVNLNYCRQIFRIFNLMISGVTTVTTVILEKWRKKMQDFLSKKLML